MRFKAMGEDRDVSDDDVLLVPVGSWAPEHLETRYGDLFLETALGPDAQQKRLLRIALDARTAEEEQGVNILYLALGFLSWFEDDSSTVPRQAPLILVPAELVRNDRTSTYDLRARDDDITANLPLQERLKQDFGLVLPEIEEDETWLPSAYFAEVSTIIDARPRWQIDSDAMQLGFYSFAKFLMVRDLEPENWPNGQLLRNELVRGILAEGVPSDGNPFTAEDRLDQILDPAEIVHIVDADASQTKVIEEVKRGHNLIVQGPPGTGKSQTIANIIAAAVYEGKTVLFMAEKMAALSVVHERLVRHELRDVCIELHSRKANKRDVANELAQTLTAAGKTLSSEVPEPDELRLTRDRLNRIDALIHDRIEGMDYTPFDALAALVRYIGIDLPSPSVALTGLERLSNDARDRIARNVQQFTDGLEESGFPRQHPFIGVEERNLQPMDRGRLDRELESAVRALDAVIVWVGGMVTELWGAAPTTLDQVGTRYRALSWLYHAPKSAADYLASFHEHAGPRLVEALQAGVAWRSAKDALQPVFHDHAWEHPAEEIWLAIKRGSTSFFARLGGRYRRAVAELRVLLRGAPPKAPAERLALVESLVDLQRKRAQMADEELWLQPVLGKYWRGERTDFANGLRTAEWLNEPDAASTTTPVRVMLRVLSELPDPDILASEGTGLLQEAQSAVLRVVTRLSLNFADAGLGAGLGSVRMLTLRDRLTELRSNLHRYDEWARLEYLRETLVDDQLGPLVEAINKGNLRPADARMEFSYACEEARWRYAVSCRPELSRELRLLDRHELVATFRELEEFRLTDVPKLIRQRHLGQVPRGSWGEMGIIRGEIGRKRGHKPIRWVMEHAGTMVQRIKPVFLMSPISVAQFLSPGAVAFDLLVIDEASQVRPEDALGAIARSRQIVVVGDSQQLPPTSFFDRLTGVEEEDDNDVGAQVAKATEMESILKLCEARGLPQRMLEWHYRSRDPSLIRVSNAEFYGNGLVLPPAPLRGDKHHGLKFRRVDGVYSSRARGGGRPGTNKIEALEVGAVVARHARELAGQSLGVVAFSKAQSDMITEVLEHARRQDNVLDALLREDKAENFFVKNIENVQGDERDVILISVGYGPQQPRGRLASMNFGPINNEGGERRLNVLFTRARVRCEVICSFEPGDIDPSRLSRHGPKVLRRFLEFAKSGRLDEPLLTRKTPESPFEEDVAEVISEFGYEVEPQVGTAGFRIDIGVRHRDQPGRYILAVECDGASYHGALWARERDRLRQDVLEGIGWRFHRIWSTDWFYRREQEIDRLRTALDQAGTIEQESLRFPGANDGAGHRSATEPDEIGARGTAQDEELSEWGVRVPPYRRASVSVWLQTEPHETPVGQLVALVEKIVVAEGPIHRNEVARRVAAAFGKHRTGKRITSATDRALTAAAGHIRHDGEFWFTAEQSKKPPVRDRSAVSGPLTRAEFLPPIEIRAAARMVIEHSGRTEMVELVRATAQLLGFKRVGSDLQETIRKTLESVYG